MLYQRALRPLLFAVDAEFAHERTLQILAAAGRLPFVASHQAFSHTRLRTCVAGIEFPNPIGLAAGCDKNARAIPVWPRFGFGFVETGTVTAQPQPGNPKPRVFRVPELQALINRLGFNSDGSTVVGQRLSLLRRGRRLPVPLGINIGKTKLVTRDDAILDDYSLSYKRLAPLADFVVVNVSSPNTPGLREWLEKTRLRSLLNTLMAGSAQHRGTDPADMAASQSIDDMVNDRSASLADSPDVHETCPSVSATRNAPPIFLKISPDMTDAELDEVVDVALDVGIAGIIATNTTIGRSGSFDRISETGGMSGRPLRSRANDVIRYLFRVTRGRLPLIGVGGIFTPEDVYERIKSGASLVQLYTSLIYEGPFLPRTLNEGLLKLMERDGVKCVAELVGAAE